MSISQPMNHTSKTSTPVEHDDSGVFDSSTVDCYQRRNEILSKAYRTEWWMVFAVVVLIASVGFVAF